MKIIMKEYKLHNSNTLPDNIHQEIPVESPQVQDTEISEETCTEVKKSEVERKNKVARLGETAYRSALETLPEEAFPDFSDEQWNKIGQIAEAAASRAPNAAAAKNRFDAMVLRQIYLHNTRMQSVRIAERMKQKE